MTRRHVCFALVLVAGLTAWGAARPGTAADAGPPARPEVVAADYAENGEEAATQRWASGQARHWRQLMVKR